MRRPALPRAPAPATPTERTDTAVIARFAALAAAALAGLTLTGCGPHSRFFTCAVQPLVAVAPTQIEIRYEVPSFCGGD